jgi:hypothetical protein
MRPHTFLLVGDIASDTVYGVLRPILPSGAPPTKR